MASLISVLMLPLIFLNLFGGIASGIWLAVEGDWRVIGFGILMFAGGAFFCGFALLPGMALSMPGILMHQKGGIIRLLSYPFMLLGLLWTFVVISGWALFSYYTVFDSSRSHEILPLAIWAYGVATGPWTYMASKESDGYASVTTFFLQIACAVSTIMIGFQLASIQTVLIVFFVVMGIAFLLSIGTAIAIALSESRSQKHSI